MSMVIDKDTHKTITMIIFIISVFISCQAKHATIATFTQPSPIIELVYTPVQSDTPKIKQTIAKLVVQSESETDAKHIQAINIKMADLMFRLVDSARTRKVARDTAVKGRVIAEKQKDSVTILLHRILSQQDRDSQLNADGFRKQQEYVNAKNIIDNQVAVYTKFGTICMGIILGYYFIKLSAYLISLLIRPKKHAL